MNYGTSYFGSRIREHVYRDLKDIKDSGFDYVVHTYSENDWMYYEKSMREIVDDTKSLGLKAVLDPWGVGGVFGGEAFSYMVYNQSENNQLLSTGKLLPVACFNNPNFRKKIEDWIISVSALGGDEILWDEPHWYIASWFIGQEEENGTWSCACNYCKKKFQDLTGNAYPEFYCEELNDFRENSLIDFLDHCIQVTNQKGMDNAICLIPPQAYSAGIQNWEKVASIKNLNRFGTDPYWIAHKQDVEPYVTQTVSVIKKLCKKYNLQEQLWIQAFSIPGGRENEIEDAFKIMQSGNVNDIGFWGYNACTHMSKLRPENPDKVWGIIQKVIQNDVRFIKTLA